MATDLKESSRQIIEKLQGEVERLSHSLKESNNSKAQLIEMLEGIQKDRDQIKELMLDKEK